MKNVTYINAGAGSGKTYTLIEHLTKLIIDKKVSPEQVILTTFTTKAANEFKEKAKTKLYELGLFDEASRLDQALIGTVHSVCQRMIGKYWFNIGLAPDMGVMAEEDTKFYLSQSLADLPTEGELRFLHKFAQMFDYVVRGANYAIKGIDYDFWQTHLKSIIDFSTNYEITDYDRSEKESLDFIRQFVKPTAQFEIDVEEVKSVLDEHETFLKNYKASTANNDRLDKLATVRRHLGNLALSHIKDLASTIGTPKGYGPLASAFLEKTSDMWYTPMVYEQQEEYIKLMFKLASRWREQFARFKREKNLLDYNDMEKYMRQLMGVESIAEDISLSFKYLFVDEFQDSSPIQVKIFDKLSDMMVHSYWVGDYKQAIFGFRGSAVSLTKAVVDRIAEQKDGCDTMTLKKSYRSLPDIVNVNNHIFAKTFASILPKENIVLGEHRQNDNDEKSLRYFVSSNGVSVAHHVAKLIIEGAKPNEIAVLARKNDELVNISRDLGDMSIVSSRADITALDTPIYGLVASLLKIIEDDRDNLAKATVAIMSENDFSTRLLINKRLEFMKETEKEDSTFLSDVKLVADVMSIRPRLKQQSIAAMVESLIIELGLFDAIKKIDDPAFGTSCLNTIISTARVYEDHCVQINMPATISGYLSYIEEAAPLCPGDPEGVQLHTYHSSKGLQWRYVILTSLDTCQSDKSKAISQEMYGVHFEYAEEPNNKTPYPEVFVRLTPWVYGSKGGKVPADIESRIEESESFAKAYKARLEESSRLLYVGMTRPQDVLILDLTTPKRGKRLLQWFRDSGIADAPESIMEDQVQWNIFGDRYFFKNMTITDSELANLGGFGHDDELLYRVLKIKPSGNEARQPRHVSPSKVKGKYKIGVVKDFKKRIPLGKVSDMAIVGDCIHQIFASIDDHPGVQNNYDGPVDYTERYNFINSVVASYGLSAVLKDPKAINDAYLNLVEYLIENHGRPLEGVYHERPFRHECDGQTIVGSIDLVWRTQTSNVVPGGDILIDFKTCPLGAHVVLDENSEHYVGNYGGQLNTYTNALEATGETVLTRYIYYPVSGLLVEVTRDVTA